MTAQTAVREDRRLRRRRETIEEVLDIAVEIMAEQGVAGLSIGEVARRLGVRPPSLYVYFPSKHAIYDALFARGASLVLEAMQGSMYSIPEAASLEAALTHSSDAFVRWSLTNPAYSQLLFWRPVPGFSPSPEAYEPAAALLDAVVARFAGMQDEGLLRSDIPAAVIVTDWNILVAGVVSQQLANAPHQSFEGGTFTAALPRLVAMFASRYSPPRRPQRGDHRADTR